MSEKRGRGGWQGHSEKYEHIKLDITLEDDVPLPGKMKVLSGLPFDTMQVGQSFATSLEHRENLARKASNYGARHNKVFTVRVTINKKTGEKEARCFRLK